MNKLEIIRTTRDQVQTCGADSRVVGDKGETVFAFVSIERSWKDNQHMISCIPAGRYTYKKCLATNKIPYEHLMLNNVTGRDGICVHRMNFFFNSEGCIGVGEKFTDLNHDVEEDITNSKATLDKILSLLPEEGIIDVIEKF